MEGQLLWVQVYIVGTGYRVQFVRAAGTLQGSWTYSRTYQVNGLAIVSAVERLLQRAEFRGVMTGPGFRSIVAMGPFKKGIS